MAQFQRRLFSEERCYFWLASFVFARTVLNSVLLLLASAENSANFVCCFFFCVSSASLRWIDPPMAEP
jgi:hypothetical protein